VPLPPCLEYLRVVRMLRKGGGVLARTLRQSGAGGLGLPQVCFGAASSHSTNAATVRLSHLLFDDLCVQHLKRIDMATSGLTC
jgi:hypothetical protein